MNRTYTLYMHKNKINNKVYIGITSQKIYKRWCGGNGYRKNPYFWNAINKYGWDNFEHIILHENLNKKEAEVEEIKAIEQYDSTNPEKGYNISVGGYSGSDVKVRPIICLELKKYFHCVNDAVKYMREYTGNYSLNPPIHKVCAHIKAYTTCGFHWIYADEFFSRYNELNDSNSYQAIQDIENKRKQCKLAIRNIDTGEIYESPTVAQKALGLKSSTPIRLCCQNKRDTAYNYHWEYIN